MIKNFPASLAECQSNIRYTGGLAIALPPKVPLAQEDVESRADDDRRAHDLEPLLRKGQDGAGYKDDLGIRKIRIFLRKRLERLLPICWRI
jgi:hypothetical protein